MYSCVLIIFFFLHLLPPWGGCPSPWACGAYPMAEHDVGNGFSKKAFVYNVAIMALITFLLSTERERKFSFLLLFFYFVFQPSQEIERIKFNRKSINCTNQV